MEFGYNNEGHLLSQIRLSEVLYPLKRGEEMKRWMVMLLGLFIIMIFSIPVVAEKKVETIEDILPSPISVGCGMDTQTPVFSGAIYSNYDTVFVHGTQAVTEVYNNPDIVYVNDQGWGHVTVLHEGPVGSGYRDAWIHCPIPSYDKKTGGVQPRVRYLALDFASDYSGVGWPEVDQIDIYNGCGKVKEIHPSPAIYNSGACSVKIIDLNGWYLFNRGLNICLHIRSQSIADRAFTIAGYGARFEW